MSRNKERRDQEIYPFGRYILPGEGGGARSYNICMWEAEWPLGVVD